MWKGITACGKPSAGSHSQVCLLEHHDAKNNEHVEDDEDEHADVARRQPFKAPLWRSSLLSITVYIAVPEEGID